MQALEALHLNYDILRSSLLPCLLNVDLKGGIIRYLTWPREENFHLVAHLHFQSLHRPKGTPPKKMIKADHFHCRSHHAKLTRKKKDLGSSL